MGELGILNMKKYVGNMKKCVGEYEEIRGEIRIFSKSHANFPEFDVIRAYT